MTGAQAEMHIAARMRTTVVVPAYRRPVELGRCLAAIRTQSLAADEVLVAVRDGDGEVAALVAEVAASWPALRAVRVHRPGAVAAMNAALDAATGDVFALTDDDAEPAHDWLARIVPIFERASDVGGVGGRDIQAGTSAERETVGRVQWFGRVIGNHHLGAGPARDVDVIKGVCSAWRMAGLRAVRFDERLRGAGAQAHWELSLCLTLQRAGWRLIYDPAIRVAHHVGERHDADLLHRGQFSAAPHEDLVYNETLALKEYFRGVQGVVFRLFTLLVGTAESPGLLMLPRVLLREGASGWSRFTATQRARSAAFSSRA